MKKNLITNKIGKQLIVAIVISLSIAWGFFLIMLKYIISPYVNGVGSPYENDIMAQNPKVGISIIVLITGITIITVILFIISFLLFVNKKVKYIKYISKRVNKIANEELGSTIQIKGKDELAELCISINSMSKELKKKFDNERDIEISKNELITGVSHDLRTPLTSIIGYADLIRKKEFKNEEELNDYSETIYNKAQNLKKLINELFEYTKLSDPQIKLNYNKFNLCSLLEQIVGEYSPIFEREGLGIKKNIPEEDIIVSVDVEKIMRVFDNLLINVKKYSDKPSNVDVKLSKENEKVIVSISNKTNKIPVENLDKLFDRFFKLDKARGENEGTGLGLAIAKKITELHGGEIWAECNEDIITFNVKLDIKLQINQDFSI